MVSYKQTLIKTIVWRIIATTCTILVSWFVTGNIVAGLAVGGIDTLIKTISYFIFERIWITKL